MGHAPHRREPESPREGVGEAAWGFPSPGPQIKWQKVTCAKPGGKIDIRNKGAAPTGANRSRMAGPRRSGPCGRPVGAVTVPQAGDTRDALGRGHAGHLVGDCDRAWAHGARGGDSPGIRGRRPRVGNLVEFLSGRTWGEAWGAAWRAGGGRSQQGHGGPRGGGRTGRGGGQADRRAGAPDPRGGGQLHPQPRGPGAAEATARAGDGRQAVGAGGGDRQGGRALSDVQALAPDLRGSPT